MEETLNSNEESTGDTAEDKTENSEDSEVSHVSVIIPTCTQTGRGRGSAHPD